MSDTNNNPTDPSPEEDGLPPTEYTEKVSRFLHVCIEGLMPLLSEEDPLREKLDHLGNVVKKVMRSVPPAGLAKEIEDQFTKLKLEKDFEKTGAEELKQIVLELTETIKEMLGSTGQLDKEMDGFIEKIQATENLKDIISLKDELIKETRKIREHSKSFMGLLDNYKKITANLTDRLHRTEVKAMVDSLTNVLNRAAYDLKIGQLIREYARYKDPTALVMVDIDHFKDFNDQYGHKAGDEVLKSVASSIQGTIRTTDYLFRYGGEEFVLLLSKINLEDAQKLAEKIRRQVEHDYYIHEEKELKVTVSLGISEFREGDAESQLFERADQAMYEAKRNGRNRVVIAD